MDGSIEVITGCMFAGKTTALIQVLTAPQLSSSQQRCIGIKHATDTRYGSTLRSHDGHVFSAAYAKSAMEMLLAVEHSHHIVGIDEAQCFGTDLADACKVLRESGRKVIACGLDVDAYGAPFPTMQALMKVADHVRYLRPACKQCGAAATFSQRISPVIDGNLMNGTAADFEPRCADCFVPLARVENPRDAEAGSGNLPHKDEVQVGNMHGGSGA